MVVAVTTTEALAAGRLVAVKAAPDDREGQLLVSARTDPETAFAELYRLTERRIVGYFYRRTACPVTAADLASETFAAAIQAVRRFDPAQGTGMRYLYGIAGKLLLQWQRHEYVEQSARRKLGMRPEVGPVAIEEVERLVDFGALKDELAEALDGLTDGVRQAVELRIFEERGYDEIAEQLGCTPGNARVRVSRGLDRLGQRLGAP